MEWKIAQAAAMQFCRRIVFPACARFSAFSFAVSCEFRRAQGFCSSSAFRKTNLLPDYYAFLYQTQRQGNGITALGQGRGGKLVGTNSLQGRYVGKITAY